MQTRRAGQPVPPTGDGVDPSNHLVEDHLGLARALARRFRGRGEPNEDLEQVALLALVGAARRFDATRGVSFSTFATVSISGELKRYFRDRSWWVRVPRCVHDTFLLVGEARETLAHGLHRSPTTREIGEYIGCTEELVLEAMEAASGYRPSSLDQAVGTGTEQRSPIDDLAAEGDAFADMIDRRRLRELVPRLGDAERFAIGAYYFDDWTQTRIALALGVSQMQVSRLLTGAIRRLRNEL